VDGSAVALPDLHAPRRRLGAVSDYGQIRLGGVQLYGESQEALANAIHTLQFDVECVVRSVPSADRNSAIAMLRAEHADLDRRVAAAVFSSVLRTGRLNVLCAEDEKAQLTMVLCVPERRAEFDGHVTQLRERLRTDGEVLIRDLRETFFPDAGSGAWTWSSHIAARAVFLRGARFFDRFRVAACEDFANVVGASG
jgi:hypothetical protein